jgi:hypothetical protein
MKQHATGERTGWWFKKKVFHSSGMMTHNDPLTDIFVGSSKTSKHPAEIYPEEPYPKCFSFFPPGVPVALWYGILAPSSL